MNKKHHTATTRDVKGPFPHKRFIMEIIALETIESYKIAFISCLTLLLVAKGAANANQSFKLGITVLWFS